MKKSPKDILLDRLARQSTWSALSVQLLSMAALIPQAQTGLAIAAAVCGCIKLFVPEDSTREPTQNDNPP